MALVDPPVFTTVIRGVVTYLDSAGVRQTEVMHSTGLSVQDAHAGFTQQVVALGGVIVGSSGYVMVDVWVHDTDASRVYYVDVLSTRSGVTASRRRLILAPNEATALAIAATKETNDSSTGVTISLAINDITGPNGEALYGVLQLNNQQDYEDTVDTANQGVLAKQSYTVTIDNGAGYSPTNTVWEIDQFTGTFEPSVGDILLTDDSEKVRVTAVVVDNFIATTFTLTLERGYDGTTKVGVSDNDVVTFFGTV